MKKKFKRFLYIFYFWLINFLANRKGIWILMYHRINDNLPPNDLIISTNEFREQMWYLNKYCEVISLRDVHDVYTQRKVMKSSRRPQVVITIDDGYRDNYQNAFPILKEFGLPATIFLVTGFIASDKKMVRYENMPSPDMLTWEEVRTMKGEDITFCPHTETHPHMRELSHLEQAAEIKSSIDALVKNTSAGIETKFFSYTYGEYNQITIDVLRELGVKIAVTVNGGINTLNDKPLELRRITADGRYELIDFMQKLAPDVRAAFSCRLRIVIQVLAGMTLKRHKENIIKSKVC